MAERIIFDLLAGKDTVTVKLKDLQKQTGKTATTVKKFAESFKSVGTAFVSVGRSIAGLTTLAAGFTAAFSLNRAIEEARSLESALRGLQSVSINTGNDFGKISAAVVDLSKDGLIPLTEVSRSLKNLLATGLDADQSIKLFKALRDSAAFNRQGQLSLAEAVSRATDGFKNQLSILVDNAGITKNLSILQKEYAESIGKTVGQLTEAEKIQANYVGILREARIFQGDYNKLLTTFSGVTSQASGSFRFLLAEIGELITRNPLILKGIREASKTFQNFTKNIKDNKNSYIELVNDGIDFLTESLANLVGVLRLATSAIFQIQDVFITASRAIIAFVSSFSEISVLQEIFKGLQISISLVVNGLSQLLGLILDELPGASSALKVIGVDFDSLREKIRNVEKSSADLFDSAFDPNNTKTRLKEIESGLDSLQTSSNSFANRIDDSFQKVQDTFRNTINETNNFKKAVDSLPPAKNVKLNVEQSEIRLFSVKLNIAGKEFVTGIRDNFNRLLDDFDLDIDNFGDFFNSVGEGLATLFRSSGAELVGGLATAIKGGGAGATKLVSSVSALVGDALLPGLGQAIGPVVELLAAGPEQARAFVKNFVDALPTIINNIAASIGPLIEQFILSLSQNADKIALSLALAMPQVAVALATSMPTVAIELAKNMIPVAISFAKGLVKGFGDAGAQFFRRVIDGGKELFRQIFLGGNIFKKIIGDSGTELINSIKEGIKDAFKPFQKLGIGGSAGDFIGDALLTVGTGGLNKILGFAEGGLVPRESRFNNDRFPARLSAGEFVIDNSLTPKLERFLNNQDQGGNNNQLLLSIIDLLNRPMQVEVTSTSINDDVLQDMILTLNRSNRRLA